MHGVVETFLLARKIKGDGEGEGGEMEKEKEGRETTRVRTIVEIFFCI